LARRLGFVVLAAVLLAPVGCRRQRFPPRGDAAAVVVVTPRRDAASPPKAAEREPNDNLERAQLLAMNPDWPVASVEGASQGKDVDVFKLVIPGELQAPAKATQPIDAGVQDPRARARRLSVELVLEECAGLGLQMLDEAGQPLESTTVDAKGGMPNLAVLPGETYFLRIKPAGRSKAADAQAAPCRYYLTAELGDFAVADEREPNGETATANPVELLGTSELAGYHGWPRDRDCYRIPLPEVTSVLDLEIEAVAGVAASLEILDGQGTRLGLAKGQRSERLALRNVILQPAPAEAAAALRQAFVVVRNETGENRHQQYVLRMSLGAPRLDAEVEPNDTPEKATAVKDGTYSGYLPAGDVDFFRYDEEGPRNVTFEVSFPRRVRGKMQIYGPGRLGAGTAEAKKPRQRLVLSDVATPGQRLYLRVAGSRGDGNANDPYTLKVSSAPEVVEPKAALPVGSPPTPAPAAKP
jgi:hypothetical protein